MIIISPSVYRNKYISSALSECLIQCGAIKKGHNYGNFQTNKPFSFGELNNHSFHCWSVVVKNFIVVISPMENDLFVHVCHTVYACLVKSSLEVLFPAKCARVKASVS